MNKWLVIGASSFTGSHFCQYLKEKGEVTQPTSLRREGWTVLLNHLDTADYIVNFAALNVVAPSWLYATDYMRVNVPADLFDQIRKWGEFQPEKRYIHISTPEVYGSTTGQVVKEDAPYNPSTPYAVSRAAAEMMLKAYHKQYGFPVLFTRSSNVYGPGQQLYRLIPKLIVSIKKGIRFPLEGSGRSHRAFVHVRDTCDGIYRAAMQGEPGQAYNMSSPFLWSIAGVVELICKTMGVRMSDAVEMAPERPGKDQDYRLDDTKIRRLGWNDKVYLEDGVRDVIDWVEKEWETLKDQSLDYVHKP